MHKYQEFHRRSLTDRDAFWREQAALVDWQTPFTSVLDYTRPPFAKWFVGGRTNLCHNAVDRHLAARGDQLAVIYLSTETGAAQRYTYRELHAEVNRCAAVLQSLGVGRGDRVLIYMPMIPEAMFAMLACVRIGAVHSVVFGGFAAASLATRIDDARPKVLFTADAGMRGGKPVPYKHLVDEAMRLASHPPKSVVIVDRGIDRDMPRMPGRDVGYAELRAEHMDEIVPCAWLESSEPSYILYTSGTTGKPKGVQRDTGGYAVALAASMRHIFCVAPGETMFTTSDIGWVVGHSYIVYAPLINGSTTILYEGLPIRPDPSIWWKIVAEEKVTTMFSSPTAIRVLKKQDPAFMAKHDVSGLRHLFLAGEPLDEPTARWASDALGGVAIVDNYWQTESGWPILSAQPGVEDTPRKFGSPSFPVFGYDVQLLHEGTAEEVAAQREGRADDHAATPARMHDHGLGRRRSFREDVFLHLPAQARVFDVRLGDARRRRLLLRARPYRRRDQCRRTPFGHARNRGSGAGAFGHRRSRCRRHGGLAEGTDSRRVRGGEGSGAGRRCRGRCADAQGSDGYRRSRIGRNRAAWSRVFCDSAAEDALRKTAAPVAAGAGRRARSGRPDNDRGSGVTGANQGGAVRQGLKSGT